ncbi:MAG: polysaccharide biosynthesis/export family protein [Candidatus Omnitrophica bacterium]|nr:polysaccharide biosynthesis/export family protein [Candidatus Omnitrophota bacterium]
MNGRLTITEVGKYIGVTPRTIMRWEKMGKIKRSRRDWRGWRFYLKEDMEDIRKFYESSYEYGNEGGDTVMNLTKATLIAILVLGASLSLPILCGYGHAQAAAVQAVQPDPSDAQVNMVQSGAVTETKTSVDVNLSRIPAVMQPPTTVAEASKYTLGPDDVIEVEVRRHPEFSGKYIVTAEGKIEYKFIGDVFVEGLTKVQLQERLAAVLSDYIIEPEVNVQILQYLSKVYYVIGAVNRPGKYFMKGNTIPILEAIVQAGLPNQASSTRKCRLISPARKGKGKVIYVNVYELLYGGDLKCNLDMKPGDVLYVPTTTIAKVIQIIRPVTDTVASAAGSAAAGAALAL